MLKKLLVFIAVGVTALTLLLGTGTYWLLGSREGRARLCKSHSDILKNFSNSPEDLKILRMVAAPLPEGNQANSDFHYLDFQYFQLPVPKGNFTRDSDKNGFSIEYDNNDKILISRDGFSSVLAESSLPNKIFYSLLFDNSQTSLDLKRLVFSQDLSTCNPENNGWDTIKKTSWIFSKQMRGTKTSIDSTFRDTKGEIFVTNQTISSQPRPAYFMDVDFQLGSCGWGITYIFRNTDHRQAILEQIGHLKNRAALQQASEQISDGDFVTALKECAAKN